MTPVMERRHVAKRKTSRRVVMALLIIGFATFSMGSAFLHKDSDVVNAASVTLVAGQFKRAHNISATPQASPTVTPTTEPANEIPATTLVDNISANLIAGFATAVIAVIIGLLNNFLDKPVQSLYRWFFNKDREKDKKSYKEQLGRLTHNLVKASEEVDNILREMTIVRQEHIVDHEI
jgi:hypothetical protein